MPNTVEVGEALLSFAVDGLTVKCDGVWQLLDRIGTGQRTVWPSVLIHRPLGRNLGPTEEIERRVADAIGAGRLTPNAKPLTLPNFAAKVASDFYEAEHLARMDGEAARAAYRYLTQSSTNLGLVGSYKTGRVPAVRWHDADGDYLFSFIPNKNDLLFYVRRPALKRAKELAREAQHLDLEFERNPSEEITLRVRDQSDAEKIVGWLGKKLPLP